MVQQVIPIVKENPPSSRPRPHPTSRVLRSATVRQTPAPPATPLVGKVARAPVITEDDEKTIEAKRTVSILVCEHCEVGNEWAE